MIQCDDSTEPFFIDIEETNRKGDTRVFGRKKKNVKIFETRPKGRFISFLSQFVGALVAIGAGILFCAGFIRNFYYGILDIGVLLPFFLLAGLGGALYLNGRKTKKLLSRFRFYKRFMVGRDYISLRELSNLTGRKVDFLRQDLQKMLNRKFFLQGRMNEEETGLFLTEEGYREYCESNEEETTSNEEKIGEELKSKPQEREEEKNDVDVAATEEEEFLQDVDFKTLAMEYLVFYEKTQRKIQSRSVQRIVTDFGVYTVRILSYEIEEEARSRFFGYYLPLTKKLLLTYEEMEQGQMEEKAHDLEDLLNTIRYSFETFAERLAEGRSMDVETDILALNSMITNL